MSQCSYGLCFHNGKINHRCSKGHEKFLIKNGKRVYQGYPAVGDGKCPTDADHYQKQGQKYCPSECYDCLEQDPLQSNEECKKNVEEYITIDSKKFYTGRPKDKKCPDYDSVYPVGEEVIG